MWGVDWVEASGTGLERIYLRQNKGDGRLLNTPIEHTLRDSQAEKRTSAYR